MKAVMLLCLGAFLTSSMLAQEAQQSSPQVPPESRVVGYDQFNQPSQTAPGPAERPNDLQVLTGKAETSVPAAQRTGYGAPQVYVNYPDASLGYGYSMRPTFMYRRGAPLFFGPTLTPFHNGFVPRRTPARPFFFSPDGLRLPFGTAVH